MDYKSVTLHQDFQIDKVFSVHYFEYMSDFYFEGESHDFWEFLCVDRGEVEVMADNHKVTLKKGEIIFHKPNEFHNLKANGIIAPNLVVVSFECWSPRMGFFEDKILTIGDTERSLLATVVSEAHNAFSSRLDDPYLTELQVRKNQPPGSEQLIKIHLEHLLIQLYRKHTGNLSTKTMSKSIKLKTDNELYNRVVDYLETNISNHLTIQKICMDNLIGRSQLQKLFREKNNCGIIDYFSQMRIKKAKQLIRDNHMNFTQIADILGYTSIHYFSRQFKKISGMSPSEYASSIKVLLDPDESMSNETDVSK